VKVAEDPETILKDILQGLTQSKHQAIVDRESAILSAVQRAQPGDTILIAGKGHEDYQIIGKEKFPFDDRKVAAACLKQRQAK
jgi:UDP-N-acetylmuramoyl-L-alanyl-D-glutamate--2,6-diaminopimelate ligase